MIVLRRAVILTLLATAPATFPAGPRAQAQEAEVGASTEFPISFGKVWFRPGRDSGLGKGRQSGLLTISEDGLEFSAKKQSHVLPWSRVEMVSYGRMSGDMDTKWVVLSLTPAAGQWSYIGYRDGSNLGYGRDTTKVFDAIVEGLRRAAAGPFSVPQGYSAYVTPFLQFALALPGDWHPFGVSDTYVDGRPMWGQTIFSPFDLSATRSDETHAEQALDAIRSGTQPAVFLDRFEPGEGFSCRRLKNAGRRKLREQIESALRPWKLTSDLEWTPQPHRYCTAWSSSSGALRGDARIDLAFYAVSDDLTGYVFAARSAAGRSIDEHFEPLARSLKTAVAR